MTKTKKGGNKVELISQLANQYLDIKVASDFGKALLTIGTVVLLIAILMLLSYLLKKLIFKLYLKNSNETVQNAVTSIIYYLDEFADKMSNKEKRKEAINNVKDLFVWRAIPIPSFIIGIIIDLEVAEIRKLQKKAENVKDPYLHPDEEPEKENKEVDKK